MENKIKSSQLSLAAVVETINHVSNFKRHHEVESMCGTNSQIVKEYHADRKEVYEFILQKLEKAHGKLQRSRDTRVKQSSVRTVDDTIN